MLKQAELFPDQPKEPSEISIPVTERLLKLHKRVFTFDTSEQDERYFRQKIGDYLNDKAESTLTETMHNAIWERNEQGKFCKYLYFNEHIQRLYIDRTFFQWAKLMCQLLSEELEKLLKHNGTA